MKSLIKLFFIFFTIFLLIFYSILANRKAENEIKTQNVVKVYPSDGSWIVSINTNISITFDSPIDNINNNSIIVENNNGTHVSGIILFNDTSLTLTFIPNSPLDYNTSYEVTCLIANNYSWRFRTESSIPIVFILYPKNKAILNSTTLKLTWKTNYLNSTTGKIFYDIYFGTNKTQVMEYNKSTCIFENHTSTSCNVIALNRHEYFWTIIPHIGEMYGYCLGETWSFVVNSCPPIISLDYPKNNEIINSTSVTLSWQKGCALLFDIYLSENKTLIDKKNETVCISKNQPETFLTLTDLIDAKTYYWTVRAYNGIYANTTNGTWSFNISLDLDKDGIPDLKDAFPNDPAASIDSDNDGYPDEWNKGMNKNDSKTGLNIDAFPYDSSKWNITDYDNENDGDSNDENNNSNNTENLKKEYYTTFIILSIIIITFLIVMVLIINLKMKKK